MMGLLRKRQPSFIASDQMIAGGTWLAVWVRYPGNSSWQRSSLNHLVDPAHGPERAGDITEALAALHAPGTSVQVSEEGDD